MPYSQGGHWRGICEIRIDLGSLRPLRQIVPNLGSLISRIKKLVHFVKPIDFHGRLGLLGMKMFPDDP